MDAEVKSLKAVLAHFSSQLLSMERDIDHIQQQQLSNNMLISNVIKTPSEDLFAIVCKICGILDIDLFARDIFCVTRLTTRKVNQIEPILVLFSNRIIKQKIMVAAKHTRLTCRNLGFSIDQRIYFGHHLTPKNQSLLQMARAYKMQHNYKYAWFSQNGFVYIKRNENSTAIQILSREYLPSALEQ